MHNKAGLTLGELLVIVGVLALLAFLLIPTLNSHPEHTNRTVCMSNLASINKAIMLYKSANNEAFPWLGDTMTAWDTTPVGINRNIDPSGAGSDPNHPKPRSITALMFMLVRQDQPPGIFRCPSDKSSVVAEDLKADANDGDVQKGEYYLVFSRPENVSYSWQAPIWKDGRFRNGLDAKDTETVAAADMTPRYGWQDKWVPKAIGSQSSQAEFERQLSYNHKGKQVNILRVAGNVEAVKRPDVGIDNDNIYTAGGSDANSNRWHGSTSLDILQHLSKRDSFLIGPVGRAEVK